MLTELRQNQLLKVQMIHNLFEEHMGFHFKQLPTLLSFCIARCWIEMDSVEGKPLNTSSLALSIRSSWCLPTVCLCGVLYICEDHGYKCCSQLGWGQFSFPSAFLHQGTLTWIVWNSHQISAEPPVSHLLSSTRQSCLTCPLAVFLDMGMYDCICHVLDLGGY